jgi:hypothetical protein
LIGILIVESVVQTTLPINSIFQTMELYLLEQHLEEILIREAFGSQVEIVFFEII